ncbi:pteridine reductase [Alteromonadaceae bacterium 2753L.S.0a.02]|nr:pteridine reductase [Alteromonadaceae bacterium 2753L.S.0a.02]
MINNSAPVALVTGGARRIGRAIVQQLHNDGYQVAIHYRDSANDAKALVNQLNRQRSDSAVLLQADLCSLSSIERMCSAFQEHFRGCDLLVNNASSFYPTLLGEITEQHWNDLFASNAKAPLFICQNMLPHFNDCASIINIADIHATRPLKNHTIYCMAKAANVMLTQSLALELAPKIRVNGIAPGAILAPAVQRIDEEKIVSEIPLRKMGTVSAITDAVKYLMNAKYVTGQIINIDGGRTLRQ